MDSSACSTSARFPRVAALLCFRSRGRVCRDAGSRSGRPFTLVELLVVVAIIGILASLLLPALRAAREKGSAIVCTGNQKQVAVALCMYTDDHDGYYGEGTHTVNSGGWEVLEPVPPLPFGSRLDWDHLGRVNFLYGDGHVSSQSRIGVGSRVRSHPFSLTP